MSEKGFFREKGGEASIEYEGFGKDFYRRGNSVKSFEPFIGLPDSEK